MESAHASNNNIVAHARGATVPDMTRGSLTGAAVRRTGKKTNCKASAEASAETKTRAAYPVA
jgi:hypothetical protein